MKLHLKSTGHLLKIAFKKWWGNSPFKESAVIAYYAIFSLPGLMVVLVTIAAYFFGSEAINNDIAAQLSSTFGANSSKQIQSMIASASESKNSVFATIIGAITILVGATGVYAQFQKSLNIIWEVKADKFKSGIWSLVSVRLFSFGLIVTIAFIMMVSLMVTTILVATADWISNHFSDTLLVVIQVVNFIVSRLVIAMLFAIIFKFFPDAKIKWKHVWLGAVITALLFLFGMYALSLYFGNANPSGGYGAAGTVILILIWITYSAMIVFYGAEFTHAYAVLHDGYIPSDKNAIKQEGRKV